MYKRFCLGDIAIVKLHFVFSNFAFTSHEIFPLSSCSARGKIKRENIGVELFSRY